MKKITVLVMLMFSMLASSISINATGTDTIIGPSVIHKEQHKILTISDILGLYSSSLGFIQITDDQYTGYGNVLGSHNIELFATNGTLQASKSISVVVVPSLGNVLAVTDYKNIFLRTNQTLTPSQIVSVLEKTGYIQITATTQMMMLVNTYTDNATTPGIYYFEFRLVNAAGINNVYSSVITVSEDMDPFIPDIVFEAPPSFFSKLWRFIEPFVYLGVALFLVSLYVKHKKKRKKAGYL